MKVGIVCPFYKPGAIGGVETVIRSLLERLPAHGILPSVIPFRLPAGPDFNSPFLSPYLQFKAAAAALSRGTDGFDIINSHNPFVTLPFALRKKTVMSVHVLSGDLYAPQKGFHPALWARRNGMRLAECASGAAAREITAVSKHIKSGLVRDANIPERKITVIYNGVDLEAVGRSIDAASASPFNGEGPNILCLGRVWRPKGFDAVLRAIAGSGFKDAHLHVAGPLEDGQYIREMRDFSAKAGMSKRFHLLGQVSEAQKYSLMHHADLVVLPSRFEGLSIVAIEALAAGSAVLASDLPPLREVLGEAAVFFKNGDEFDLAAKMASLLSSGPSLRRLRSQASGRSGMFSMDAMVGSYVRAYERAAA